MRWFLFSLLALSVSVTLDAHHPDRESQPVHPRYDLIGPLGTRLPMSHRRKYNRPTNLGGKIAYWIAPSSQEAMAWHDATHRGLYENHRPRTVVQYFYPKPWEAIRIGARTATASDDSVGDARGIYERDVTGETEIIEPGQPIVGDNELIEQ